MRVKQMVNKRECLECLFTEINILTECRHPNVVKILDANFDGTMIKEQEVSMVKLNKIQLKEQPLFSRSSSSEEEMITMGKNSPVGKKTKGGEVKQSNKEAFK
jgi:hypothetical protein